MFEVVFSGHSKCSTDDAELADSILAISLIDLTFFHVLCSPMVVAGGV